MTQQQTVQAKHALPLKPWQAGLLIGLVASLAQASYYLLPQAVAGVSNYRVYPPAYGFCMFCHVRDTVNWVVQNFVPQVTPAPVSIIAPTLTIFGVLLGAFFAAVKNKQFAWRRTTHPAQAFVWGAIVSFFTALLGACPVGIIVRAGYLEPFAFVGIGAVALGAVAASFLVRKELLQ